MPRTLIVRNQKERSVVGSDKKLRTVRTRGRKEVCAVPYRGTKNKIRKKRTRKKSNPESAILRTIKLFTALRARSLKRTASNHEIRSIRKSARETNYTKWQSQLRSTLHARGLHGRLPSYTGSSRYSLVGYPPPNRNPKSPNLFSFFFPFSCKQGNVTGTGKKQAK